MTEFSRLNLTGTITKALVAEGYETPTAIQSQAIPLILSGRDLLGIAQTGTGKTAAFALPILDRIGRTTTKRPQRSANVLVLAPTRELAGQIADSFRVYGKFIHPKVATAFGGVPINRQIRQLQHGVDVLIATPGRLIDLIDRRALTLDHVETLVLDEADQMLDLGFIHALRKIVPLLPSDRQTLFFSATMPKSIADLAAQYLTDPAKVSVAPAATTAERVDQQAIFVRQADKQALLTRTLRDPAIERALVFTRTKHGADRVVRHLKKAGIEAAAIHGNKSQPQRERALEAFRQGRCRILVATDIAARGIDIDDVSHVINFEIPNVPEQYVHRIGRTARAGATGLAISFVADDERPYLRSIERVTRQSVPIMPLPEGFEAPAEIASPRRPDARQDKPSGNAPRRRRRTRGNSAAHNPRPASKKRRARRKQSVPA